MNIARKLIQQNNQGQTLASVYSVRPVTKATVSMPLDWDELNRVIDPGEFTLLSVPAIVKKQGDIWKKLLTTNNDLKKALLNLQRSL